MARFTMELSLEIWDDDTGERVVVSEDADGLGLVQVQYVTESGKADPNARLTMPIAQAELVATAIGRVVAELRKREPEQP